MSTATEPVLTKQLKTTTDDLNRIVSQANNALIAYQGQVKSLKKWFLFGLIARENLRLSSN